MIIEVTDKNEAQLKDMFRNLLLVAPGKGEAKKTVSQGNVFFNALSGLLEGYASDDFMFLYENVDISVTETPPTTYLVSSQDLKDALPSVRAGNIIELPTQPQDDTTQKYWFEHVDSLISGWADPVFPWGWAETDRYRKFSLLEPRGNPIRKSIVRWHGIEILRFWSSLSFAGALALVKDSVIYADGDL